MTVSNALDVFTVPEIATRLRLKPTTIRKMIREKLLLAVKVGSQWRIPASELSRVVEEGTRERIRERRIDPVKTEGEES